MAALGTKQTVYSMRVLKRLWSGYGSSQIEEAARVQSHQHRFRQSWFAFAVDHWFTRSSVFFFSISMSFFRLLHLAEICRECKNPDRIYHPKPRLRKTCSLSAWTVVCVLFQQLKHESSYLLTWLSQATIEEKAKRACGGLLHWQKRGEVQNNSDWAITQLSVLQCFPNNRNLEIVSFGNNNCTLLKSFQFLISRNKSTRIAICLNPVLIHSRMRHYPFQYTRKGRNHADLSRRQEFQNIKLYV